MSERETAMKRILSQLSFMVINAEDRRIVAAEIEALVALGADPVPVCQWREIATAPRGTMMLVCDMKATQARDWCWVDWQVGGELILQRARKPTHWQPLPAPPVALVPAEQTNKE